MEQIHNFKYVSKKEVRLREVYKDAVDLIRETQDMVRDEFSFQYHAVGSYSRNMVTHDPSSNVGFDLDFDLVVNDPEDWFTAKEIKNILQQAMKQIARKHGYDFPEDSTRVLTLKCKDRKHAKILHSIDFAITKKYMDDEGCVERKLIRYDKKANRYNWCELPSGEYDLQARIDWLKSEQLWGELRKRYLDKKKNNTNSALHSRQLFSMTVNELLQSAGYFSEAESIQSDTLSSGKLSYGTAATLYREFGFPVIGRLRSASEIARDNMLKTFPMDMR